MKTLTAIAKSVGSAGLIILGAAAVTPSVSATTGASSWSSLGTRQTSSGPGIAITRPANARWFAYDPPATYSGRISQPNVVLPMDDGVSISLDVVRPAAADGSAARERLPTLVTFTPYNKNVGSFAPILGGADDYFIHHGYNQVIVDLRGTGRSGGSWDPFSAREQKDYPQVLDWIVAQPWSNGVIGMHGISATATTALLAAGSGHPAIRAVFPIVAHGDVYRDLVFVGGQASIAFLPAWMSAVTLLGVVNPTFYDQPGQYVNAVVEHLAGLDDFVLPRPVAVVLQQEGSAYDNDYWAAKSPLEVAGRIRVPTFVVGGLFDIFQRGEPLNYEALKNHTTTKLLLGPWHHLQAAAGDGLSAQGLPNLQQIALIWFDRYLKGIRNGAERLPNVTQWVWGHEQYSTSVDWPHPQARAQRLFLQADGGLAASRPAAWVAPALVVQQPVGGICSESTLQISLGLTGYTQLPCFYQDNLAQLTEASFDTPVLDRDLYINGPIQADIWMSTTAANAGLVVRVSDLQPDGTAKALSSGLQTASLRAVDTSRSRTLDGQMIQPWHPFTSASALPVGRGNKVKVPVEVFATSALIRKGHRLRISVGPSNFPFATMPAPTLLDSVVGVLSIYRDAAYPSSIVLPVVPATALRPATKP